MLFMAAAAGKAATVDIHQHRQLITFSGGITADLRSGILTVALVGVMALVKKISGRQLSSILLICVSAVLGILVYGI